MSKRILHIVNGITIYRLTIAPVLLFLVLAGAINVFKWLLPLSFASDLADGFLARKFKVTSVQGARIDSLADDLTIMISLIALFVLKSWFVRLHWLIVIILFSLLAVQIILSLIRYGKMSSFHTRLAKLAALFQGLFLIVFFISDKPYGILFYLAVILTIADLLEEIILVLLLPQWQANVKGFFWLLHQNKKKDS